MTEARKPSKPAKSAAPARKPSASKAPRRAAGPTVTLGDFVLGKVAGVSAKSARFEPGGLEAIRQVLAQATAAGDATADAAVNETFELVGYLSKKGMATAARQLAKLARGVIEATTRRLSGRLEDRRAQAARFAQFLAGNERPEAPASRAEKAPKPVKASSLAPSRRG